MARNKEDVAAEAKLRVDPDELQYNSDVSQHTNYLLKLEIDDLVHSVNMAEALVDGLLERERTRLPVDRLEAFIAAAEQAGTLEISDQMIMSDAPKILEEGKLAIMYEKEIAENPKFMEELRMKYLVDKRQDIRANYSELLLTGISAETAKAAGLTEKVGVIPKLRASIAAAVASFTAINQSNFQTEIDRTRRLTIVEEAIAGISALAIEDADEVAHYEVLLKDFKAKLAVSLEAAIKRFAEINQSAFQTEANRPRRLTAVETAVAGVSALSITDADELAYYEVLLKDFGSRLSMSIDAAIKRFTAINQGFQKITEMPSRLEKAEAAIQGIDDLHLEVDQAVHYGVLLQDFIVKLRASIATAEEHFDAKGFIKRSKSEDPRLVIAAIKGEIKDVSKLSIDEDAKRHYYNLLVSCCNHLEGELGIARTQFDAYGFNKISNPFERLRAMQAARAQLSKPTQPIVTQFQSSVAAGTVIVSPDTTTLGELSRVVAQYK